MTHTPRIRTTSRHVSPRRASSAGHATNRNGSVLILAIWVLFFLAALAVAVGSHVSGLLATADYVRVHVTTMAAARAGAMLSAQAVAGQTNAWDGVQAESWTHDTRRFEAHRIGECIVDIGYTTMAKNGLSITNAGLIGEEARINLNLADTNVLAAYITLAGGQDERAARAVAGAIADWRDPDDEVLTGGAESAYYSRVSPPYQAANAKFGVLEELLLVKGIDERLFDRLAPGLTVHGSGHVNLNAASRIVLESVGLASARTVAEEAAAGSLARKIVAFREAGNVFDERDSAVLRKRLDEATPLNSDEQALFAAMMGKVTIQSTCFRGSASARLSPSGAGRGTVEFVFDGAERRFVQWQEM